MQPYLLILVISKESNLHTLLKRAVSITADFLQDGRQYTVINHQKIKAIEPVSF